MKYEDMQFTLAHGVACGECRECAESAMKAAKVTCAGEVITYSGDGECWASVQSAN